MFKPKFVALLVVIAMVVMLLPSSLIFADAGDTGGTDTQVQEQSVDTGQEGEEDGSDGEGIVDQEEGEGSQDEDEQGSDEGDADSSRTSILMAPMVKVSRPGRRRRFPGRRRAGI
ncbi:MAG: hypothetical protein U5N58_06650 [Actinomycetota bacterium]|nr:hypothetical protein [Actinomycetota bacterium]